MLSNLCVTRIINIIAILILCNFNNALNEDSNYHVLDSVSTQDVIGGDVFFEIIDPIELEYTYRLRPAKDFGAPFNSKFKVTKAALVPAIPPDGCSQFKNAKDMKGNVALIERGECSFLSKTIFAEKAGAVAAIITETAPSTSDIDYYIEMIHDKTPRDSNIPAGFLLGKNGRIIQSTLDHLSKKYALINLPVNLTFTPPHLINHPPWLGW